MKPKKMILDHDKVGTKGYPIHWEEMGLQPPLVEVDIDHPQPEYKLPMDTVSAPITETKKKKKV